MPAPRSEQDIVEDLTQRCLNRIGSEGHEVVETVLAEHPEHAAAVRKVLATLRGCGLLDGDPTGSALEPPRQLGDFELIERLGSGSMGEVWLAEQRSLKRRVALKLMLPGHQVFARSKERFRREIEASSRLDHPNICPVYEADEVDGVPYIAMRLVAGQSLAHHLAELRGRRDGACGSERSRMHFVRLVEKLARALHAAHEAGLVHRDVKPGNVLIDRTGEPILVDFGLALDGDSEVQGLTQTGDRLGTPAYMAPEQVSGRATVDRRTDVYGLGVTLYECLTLRRPFGSAVHEDLYQQILRDPPTDPRQFDRGLSRELCIVLQKAMAKDKADRFATMEEFADELQRIVRHEPIRSRRPSLGLRAVRWCQRNRAAAGVLLSAVLGLCVSLWFLGESRAAQRRAEALARANRSLAWLHAAEVVASEEPVTGFRYARQALREVDPEADPAVVAKVLAGAQEAMFRLRAVDTVAEGAGTELAWAPGGKHLVVLDERAGPRVFHREEGRLVEQRVGFGGFRRQSNGWVSFAPDGSEMLLVSDDGFEVETVQGDGQGRSHLVRYDLTGAQPRPVGRVTASPGARVEQVVFHPDPRRAEILVVYGRFAELRTRDGRLVAPPLLPDGGPHFTVGGFLEDGRIVAAGSIFDPGGDRLCKLALPAGGVVGDLFVLPDRLLVLHRPGQQVYRFGADGTLQAEASLGAQHIESVWRHATLSPDHRHLAIAGPACRVRVLDARSFAPIADWDAPVPAVRVRFSPDSRQLMVVTGNQSLLLYDLTGRVIDGLSGPRSGDWSPDGAHLVTVDGRAVRRVGFAAQPGVTAFVGLGDPGLAVSPAGERVVFTSDLRGLVYCCDGSGRLLRSGPLQIDARPGAGPGGWRVRTDVAFAGEEEAVVTADFQSTFQLVRARAEGDADWLVPMQIPASRARHMVRPVRGDRWLIMGPEYRLALWHEEAGVTVVSRRFGIDRAVLTEGRDGVLVAGARRFLALLDGDGKERWHTTTPSDVSALALSRRGRVALVGLRTETHALLYDLDRPGAMPLELRGHQGSVVGVAIAPDGARLATASDDGTVRVWDRARGATLYQFRHPGVRDVGLTATGQLVTAGTDGTVRFWDLALDVLRGRVGRLEVEELQETERRDVRHLTGASGSVQAR